MRSSVKPAHFFALAFAGIAFLIAALHGKNDPYPAFVLPAHEYHQTTLPASFEQFTIPSPTPSVHSATLAPLSNGRIMAIWFGGQKEGAQDVKLYQAIFANGVWQPAQAITSRMDVQQETKRNIRKIGNPVLMRDPQGNLHLFFVSVSYGGWAGSAINHKRSTDEGFTWSPAKRIITSPFLNLSTLVRGVPLNMQNGQIGLPVYHEFITKFPEWLRLGSDGQVIDKVRMQHGQPTLQPSVIPSDASHALALLRYAGQPPNRIWAVNTDDAGQTWHSARPLALPNPNSSVTAIRLRSGTLLLAYNPTEHDRNQLALATSDDNGAHWQLARLLEQSASPSDEFSYPALLEDAQGHIHLTYTYKRQSIKHVIFTEAWLRGGA